MDAVTLHEKYPDASINARTYKSDIFIHLRKNTKKRTFHIGDKMQIGDNRRTFQFMQIREFELNEFPVGQGKHRYLCQLT
uniref:Uncharacterized protein n=1 Tax=Romanomermis culicivorax TaxID=13658 RepID=A0A915KHY3_ROMCU